MPAIHPPRLKIQVNELVQNASDVDAFCRSYHDFLEVYADRTFRPGKVGEPPPLMRSYQVPVPVLKAVDKELRAWAQSNRDSALDLADGLWLEPFLEFRLTAATLIGEVDPLPVKHIFRRVETWIQPNTEERIVNALINKGLQRILLEGQTLYIAQIDTWLRSTNIERNRLGLKASHPLLEQKKFHDFPILFKRLVRFMRSKNSPLRNEVLLVIKLMADKAPEETAYFLEGLLQSSGDNPQVAWYVRNSLNFFQGSTRYQLRKSLVGSEGG